MTFDREVTGGILHINGILDAEVFYQRPFEMIGYNAILYSLIYMGG